MKFKIKRKTLKGRWKPVPPFDKLSWLYDQGFIGSNIDKFRPSIVRNKYEHVVSRRAYFPRFAITEVQKRYNWLTRIKWDDGEPIVVQVD